MIKHYPNKVPYSGPGTLGKIITAIAEDAREAGMEFMTDKIVEYVLNNTFKERGAFYRIPLFFSAKVKYFGSWNHLKKGKRKRRSYERDREKFLKKFRSRKASNKAMVKASYRAYGKYLDTTGDLVVMEYEVWVRATGRKKKQISGANKLSKITNDYHKMLDNKYGIKMKKFVPNKKIRAKNSMKPPVRAKPYYRSPKP